MSFVEYLRQDNWFEFLERTFDSALRTLETDPSGSLASAADDLRGWLQVGGAARVREAVAAQTADLRLSPARRDDVLSTVDRALEHHRARILTLIARGVLPATQSTWVSALGIHEDGLASVIARFERGEPPPEAELRALCRSDAEHASLVAAIEASLPRRGPPTR
jgi:hypothetical protein